MLNYTEGSPCDDTSTRLRPRKITDGDDDDKDDDEDRKHGKDSSRKEPTRRKSSLISFVCERDSLAPKAHLSFLGASPDECTYFFEARSMAACGSVSEAQQSLGPAGVFGVIALIAAAVYVLGGIAYQRTVMHQRGWRQLPNYNLWAGIFGFVNVSTCQSSPDVLLVSAMLIRVMNPGHVHYPHLLLRPSDPPPSRLQSASHQQPRPQFPRRGERID